MDTLVIEHDLLEPSSAHCSDTSLIVTLIDGATLVTPLWWYPPLMAATHEQRNNIELSPFGVHWPDLDEDLSIEGMLKVRRYPDAKPSVEAAE